MVIHLSIFCLIILCSLIWEKSIRHKKLVRIYNGENYYFKSNIMPWLIVFGYFTFLAAMRSNINDTAAYISSFEALGTTWEDFFEQVSTFATGKDWAFDAISIMFKILISDNYHLWFLMYATIESLIIIHVCRMYSVSFLDTCFFFFCSTLYHNYFTMMRQWIAVVIIFAAIGLMKERKTFVYIIICIAVAQIHMSAYLMIIVYFLVRNKVWSRRQNLLVFAFAIAMFFFNPILSNLNATFSDFTYSYVLETMSAGNGSSPVRILIALVPVILAFIGRKRINPKDNVLNICINMSLINFLLNILAMFTSGLFIIRFSTYTNIFNLLLYPYLLNVLYTGRNKTIIKSSFYIFYFAFYIYQMNYGSAWGYASDILGIF